MNPVPLSQYSDFIIFRVECGFYLHTVVLLWAVFFQIGLQCTVCTIWGQRAREMHLCHTQLFEGRSSCWFSENEWTSRRSVSFDTDTRVSAWCSEGRQTSCCHKTSQNSSDTLRTLPDVSRRKIMSHFKEWLRSLRKLLLLYFKLYNNYIIVGIF